MKKQTLIYFGFLAGVINIVGWFTFDALFQSEEFDFGLGEILGYAAMLLALSTVFFGVKRYRDLNMDGKISFGQAFVNGLIIVGVASSIYVIGWEIYYPNFASDFSADYSAYLLESYREQGLTDAEIEVKKAEMEIWTTRYQNPLYRVPMTLMEILPLGILVCLISAFILKRK